MTTKNQNSGTTKRVLPGQVVVKGANYDLQEGNPDFKLICFSPGDTQERLDERLAGGEWDQAYYDLTVPMPIGASFTGRLLKVTPKDAVTPYALLEEVDKDGKNMGRERRFRTWTPGQLIYKLGQLNYRDDGEGDIVRVTYEGKSEDPIEVDTGKKKTEKVYPHQFAVEVVNLTH